jgi:hypothetical protein
LKHEEVQILLHFMCFSLFYKVFEPFGYPINFRNCDALSGKVRQCAAFEGEKQCEEDSSPNGKLCQ